MDYADYAELRRRAEKRLTVISAWPLVLAQGAGYLLMAIRSPLDLGIPMLATMFAAGFTGVAFLVYRQRTAANRRARREAIDGALEEAVDAGWPIEEPSLRDLRLLATLLDDDMDTRAGIGRVVVWSSAAAVLVWVLTFVVAGSLMYREMWGPWQIIYPFIYTVWLGMFGAFALLHRGQRRQSEQRIRAALRRASGRLISKPKRAAEAPWWTDDEQPALDKRKRTAPDEEWLPALDDDGEIADDFDAPRRVQRSS